MYNRKKGIFYILLAAFSFATMSLFVQLSGDVPFVQKVFFRNLIAVVAAFYVIMRQGRDFSFKKENLKFLLLRSIFGTLGVFFNFYAIDNLILADANTVAKLAPFFVILFSFFILKEHIKSWQVVCIAVAFAGSIFIINPGIPLAIFTEATFETGLTEFPAVIGMLGAVCGGITYTMIRRLSIGGERGPFIVFFFSVFSTVACLPLMIFSFEPMTPLELFYLLAAGLFASFGQFAVTAAYSNAPAKSISIYDYSQIFFSAVYSIIIFGTVPSALSIIGYLFIVGAAIFMYINESKSIENK